MKRLLSALLAAIMVFSLCSFLSITGVAANTEISNTSPAITADVGETIDLTSYSVVFDGDTEATENVTWYNEAGNEITKITPNSKGVTPIHAESGDKAKTIYVVAKEADETEYVLYEVNFSEYSNLSELKAEGWNFLGSASHHNLSDGTYVLGSNSNDYARAILPEWLGEFGDYGISADLKMLTTTDTGRWVGIVYRIQNKNNSYYPYLHMCVREATTASGIEFAERTASNTWNVVLKSSGDVPSLKTSYNNLTVNAFGDTIAYSLNGTQVTYVTEDFIGASVNGSSAARYEKGMLGLTMNYGTVAFKNVKVTVQESAPVKPVKQLDLINNSREDVNLINPIANVEAVEAVSDIADTQAGSVFVPVLKTAADYTAAVKACVQKQKLATYYIETKQQAEWLISAMKANGCKDANVISDDSAVLSYVRTNMSIIRTGLSVDPKKFGDDYNALRVAVRSAPATFVVLDTASENITKELVMEIQEYAVAVWAMSETMNKLEILQLITAGVNGIVTADALETAEIINTYLAESAMTRTPIMIGHRGNPSQAPENTMASFIAAYENGADVFEVDVEITKDGHVIIMHDNTLNRTTTYTGTKTVNQMTLAEIKAEFILSKNNDKTSATTEKVPTLDEVLDYFKDKDCKIFVEFKGSNAQNVPATMALLDKYGMDYLVDVISFNYNFLIQTQANSTGMSTGYLVSGEDNGRTTEDALEALYNYLVMAQSANSTINPASGIVQSNGNFFTKAATDRGITVWPWTYTFNSNQIGFLSGCDGVTTDDMQWVTDMAKYLEAPVNTTIAVGQQFALGATVVTYGNTKYTADSASTVAKVIEGEDVVTVVDGKLVGLKEGTAEVILGYRTTTTTGGIYVVYTQPFTVTVENGKDALVALVEYARLANRTDYLVSVYEEIEATLAEAEEILFDNTASEEEIAVLCVRLASLINDSISKTPASLGASYTTTAPNRGDGNTYNDDGRRLTDGSKANSDGGTSAYAGWNNGVKVEVIVDLGEIKQTNTYTIYGAYNFWGIVKTKSASIAISKDGKTYTDLGKLTYTETKVNATTTLYTYSIFTEELNEARYIKFTVTPSGNHTWLDEVEATVTSGATESEGILGDVNNDEVINQYDYILVKRHHFATRTLTDSEFTRADVNKDGVVNQYDYLLIARHYFGTYVIK